MIYRVPIKITTLSPVLISEQSGESVFTATKDVFSGNVIRGGLAKIFSINSTSTECLEENESFYEYFLSGDLHFTSAYPFTSADPSEVGNISFPLSISIVKHKVTGDIKDLAKNVKKGEELGAGYKPIKGFAFMSGNNCEIINQVSVKKSISFHMSRQDEKKYERIRGSSIDGKIFNYEYIAAGQDFKAYIYAEKKEALQKFLSEKCFREQNIEFYVGRSKHTQYGKCHIQFEKIEEDFINVSTEQLKSFIDSVNNESAKEIAIRFTSAFIPNDDSFQDFTSFFKDINLGISTIITKSIATIGETESFVSVWGLKRPRQRVVEAGSILKLKKTDNNSLWNLEDLKIIMEKGCLGIGQRTVEGFGTFDIWDYITPKILLDKEKKKQTETKSEQCNEKQLKEIKKVPEVKRITGLILQRRIEELLQKEVWNIVSDVIKEQEEAFEPKKYYAGNDNIQKKIRPHIFAMLENAITKNNSGNVFEQMKSNVKKAAQAKLEELRIDKYSMWELLSDEKLWKEYSESLKENVYNAEIQKIANFMEISLPEICSQGIYKAFWLRFFRYARKKTSSGGENDKSE